MSALRWEGRIPAFDGWRGVAVLLVIIGHFLYFAPIDLARLGVEMFFVLSGALMANILFVHKIAIPIFFIRRFSRIYPALLAFVLVMLARIAPLDRLAPAPIDALAALTFTLNYVRASQNAITTNLDHVWSLCIEEHIYVLLASVAVWTRRTNRRALPVLVALAAIAMANGIVSTLWFGQSYIQAYWRTDVRGASILAGAIAYLCADKLRNSLPFNPDLSFIAVLTLGLLLQSNFVHDTVKYTVGTTCLAVAINLLPQTDLARRLFQAALLSWLGMISFSVYLWQQPFSRLMFGADTWTPAQALPVLLVVAVLAFLVIERPARREINLRLKRQQC